MGVLQELDLYLPGFEALGGQGETNAFVLMSQLAGLYSGKSWKACGEYWTELLKNVLSVSLGYFVYMCNYYSLIVFDSIKNT